jgi:hypothetical protein
VKKWVVCRTLKGTGIEYRSTDPNVLDVAGWVDGKELRRVRVWDERETAMEYMAHLSGLYPQLAEMEMVKVLVFSEVGILGVMD